MRKNHIGNFIDESSVSFDKTTKPYEPVMPFSGKEALIEKARDPYKARPEGKEFVSLVKTVYLPRHLYIPENGYYFDQYARVSIPIGNVKTAIISFVVPSGMEGWLKNWGQDVAAANDWNFLTWSLEINNTTVPPYGDITRQLGTFTEMTDILKHVNEGDTIKLSAKQNTGAAILVWGRLKGWYYPMRRISQEVNKYVIHESQ